MNPTYLEDEDAVKLSLELGQALSGLNKFLKTHVFDPIAAFGYDPNAPRTIVEPEEGTTEETQAEDEVDSIAEELKKIGHPNTEPLQIIRQFESVLLNFGPWCAQRSLTLLIQLVERFKVIISNTFEMQLLPTYILFFIDFCTTSFRFVFHMKGTIYCLEVCKLGLYFCKQSFSTLSRAWILYLFSNFTLPQSFVQFCTFYADLI